MSRPIIGKVATAAEVLTVDTSLTAAQVAELGREIDFNGASAWDLPGMRRGLIEDYGRAVRELADARKQRDEAFRTGAMWMRGQAAELARGTHLLVPITMLPLDQENKDKP